ncbi:2-oxoacid dehydrogenases acyltransferase-domain-containing protein [Cladochytrium replicatum]|nr:2-oxoacid dehydrogenases acyltransferase-domain-containing protein [Cladochytrium replicatum]
MTVDSNPDDLAALPPHTIVSMPALSPTMTQGNIGKWQKKIGDQINPGDILCEIETDKAQMDFECQEEGYLAQILIQSGEKDVPVNKPIAVFVESQDLVSAFANFTAADAGGTVAAPSLTANTPASTPAPAAAAAPSVAAPSSSASESTDRVFASPVAKVLAAEKGIPLDKIVGTGPGGRITKSDVENYKPSATAAPTIAAAPALVSAPTPVASSSSLYEDIPVTQMRKIIASRLLQSKQTVPHYYLTAEIKVDRLLKLRELLNAQANGKYKLSVNDFVIKASSLALVSVPEVNSAWQDTFIRRFKSADIAVAVATESGLITPIVSAAESKGLSSISNSMKDLAARAKLNKLAPNEYQGGSFTISNLGMFGIDHFTAIINQPHAAILAVGSTSDKLVLDPSSEKGFAVEKVMKVTLSCDHRVVDGAVGATWLGKFKGYLEEPLSMLL